jgi:hypothetical protein
MVLLVGLETGASKDRLVNTAATSKSRSASAQVNTGITRKTPYGVMSVSKNLSWIETVDINTSAHKPMNAN